MYTIDIHEDSPGARCIWTVKERDPRTGLYVPRLRRKNVITNTGLTSLASALGGGYTPPQYLVVETTVATLANTYAAGVNSVQLNTRPDQAGDTSIVLGLGLASQETVNFTSVTGTGPYTYALSTATTQAHTQGDPCTRSPLAADTMVSVKNEAPLDPVNSPTSRIAMSAGYSQGVGNYTMQFYITGVSTLVYVALIGLADSGTVGQGNLHNHLPLGYNHVSGQDLEIDVSLTLSAS